MGKKLTIEEVMNKYYEAYHLPNVSDKNLVNVSHIFDKTKSFEWNMAEAAKHNSTVYAETKDLQLKRNEAIKQALNDYYNFVASELNLSVADTVHLIHYIMEDIADDELYHEAFTWLSHICEIIRRNDNGKVENQ